MKMLIKCAATNATAVATKALSKLKEKLNQRTEEASTTTAGKWGGSWVGGKMGWRTGCRQGRAKSNSTAEPFRPGFCTVFPLKIGLELQLDRKPKTFCTLDDAKQFVINQCLEFSCFSTWLRFRPLPFANNQSSWKSEDNTKK